MKDFYCPYCEHGMNKDEVNVHEDDVLGEWDDVVCISCEKTFILDAEPSIDYYTRCMEQSS